VDFPIKNAFDTKIESEEAFIVKINASGKNLDFSSYLGGNDWENAWGLTTDDNYVYICGRTKSQDFPIKNPFQSNKKNDFDLFISKINQKTGNITYSTFLGGNNYDDANRIEVNQNGWMCFTALTSSLDFPVINSFDGIHNGKYDAYVAILSADGTNLVYSSFIGGRNNDDGYHTVIDQKNNIYVIGNTSSFNFPTKNGFDNSFNGLDDVFITKLSLCNKSLIKNVKGGKFLSVTFSSKKTPLNWSINLNGNILTNGQAQGSIPAYTTRTIFLDFTFGFGVIDITIKAKEIIKQYKAILIGSLFINPMEIKNKIYNNVIK
jgi:hypothetical protein